MKGVDRLTSELEGRGFSSAATYLKNPRDELFTVKKLQEQGTAPLLVMVTAGPVERKFREINRRTEIGVRGGTMMVQRGWHGCWLGCGSRK